jgi:hypothetical protein
LSDKLVKKLNIPPPFLVENPTSHGEKIKKKKELEKVRILERIHEIKGF